MRNRNRTTEIIIALLLLVVGVSAVTEAPAIFVILFLLGLLYLIRQAESGSRWQMPNRTRSAYDSAPIVEQERQAHAEPVYKHALDSVKRAGLNPDTLQVLPVDIGVMAFKAEQDPVVHRTWPVPDDVDYVQPYVQLRLPTKAEGRVRFEITDSEGEVLFIHEDIHQLVRGRNLVTPSARLPVHDAQLLDGRWQLRVFADGVPLATHEFEWEETSGTSIRRHLGEDGEISTEMRAVLAESRLQKMSLDELLSYQDEEAARQQKR